MRTKIGQGLFALLLSLLVLCGTYRFQNVLLPVGQFTFQSEGMRAIQLLSPSPAFPVPFPRDYLLGLDQQRSIMEQLHPVFLDGSWSVTGFPHYYLMTLLWKLPHILQLLLALGLVQGFFFSRFRSTRGTTVFLLISALFVIGVASREGMQLGVRYIMPVLPLFFLLAGPAVGWLQRGGDRWRLMISCLLIGVCDLSLRFHPSHLSYFNEWAGGPIGGRKHLLDSNLDWGQDLHLVKQYMSEQGWKEIGLAYFGTVPPQLFEIKFEIPHSWEPRPGRYAVSVNYVMGRPHVLTLADGSSRGTDIGEFSYFRNLNSVKTLGGSIDIYDVSEDDVAEWKKHFARDARPSN